MEHFGVDVLAPFDSEVLRQIIEQNTDLPRPIAEGLRIEHHRVEHLTCLPCLRIGSVCVQQQVPGSAAFVEEIETLAAAIGEFTRECAVIALFDMDEPFDEVLLNQEDTRYK